MNIVPLSAEAACASDWRDPLSYDWIETLSRRGLAWEFLRRNADYKAAVVGERTSLLEDEDWPLIRLENPCRDARAAQPLWRSANCDDVVTLHAAPPLDESVAAQLNLGRLKCSVTVTRFEALDRLHMLFAQAGRFLQLEIQGQSDLESAALLMPVLSSRTVAEKRALALKRLADLADTGELRAHLYPHDKRASRFKRMLQAVDGALAGARHRDIAAALYGADRVERDWIESNHLRDHIRRTISQGRRLVDGGYRKLLG